MSRFFSRIVCIMNPAAGTRRRVREAVIGALDVPGIGVVFHETTGPKQATDFAASAVKEGADLVVAIGGDGTLNEVGQALIGTGVPMGVVPVGSGNAFAHALGMSLQPRKACRQLLNATVQALDVGRVGDTFFLSTVGIGFDAEVARLYRLRSGKRRGFWPYAKLSFNLLGKIQPEQVRLVLDESREFTFRPLLLVVANTAEYGNGIIIAPGAVPNDGLLKVCVVTHIGWTRLLLNAGRLFLGSIDRMPGVKVFDAKTVRIERLQAGWFQFDGESREGSSRLLMEVLPGALKMALPRALSDTRKDNSAGIAGQDLTVVKEDKHRAN